MQRLAPVRSTLKHGQVLYRLRHLGNRLHAGGSGADHSDTLALEGDVMLRPEPRVVGLTLEGVNFLIRGNVGADNGPIAVMRNADCQRLPSSEVSNQLAERSCQWAATTRVLNSMSRFRSNLSATKLMYLSVSG